MGINKSGVTDPAMLIRGGRVTVNSRGLVIDPQGLTNPPATTESTALARVDPATTAIDIARPDLNLIYTETLIARIKESIVSGEGIIVLCKVAVVAIPIAIAAIVTSWVMAIAAWLTVNAAAIGTAVVVILALAALVPILLGGRGGGETTAVVKGCAKGPTPGPIRVPIRR
jgi:hypothetical protein